MQVNERGKTWQGTKEGKQQGIFCPHIGKSSLTEVSLRSKLVIWLLQQPLGTLDLMF
jgi:hypothetical protein